MEVPYSKRFIEYLGQAERGRISELHSHGASLRESDLWSVLEWKLQEGGPGLFLTGGHQFFSRQAFYPGAGRSVTPLPASQKCFQHVLLQNVNLKETVIDPPRTSD